MSDRHDDDEVARVRRRVRDAALRLQLLRVREDDAWRSRGAPRPGVEVISGTMSQVRERIRALSGEAHELLAVTLRTARLDDFLLSHRANQVLVERGVRMLSLFDTRDMASDIRDLLIAVDDMPYYFCFGPEQVKVIDRQRVLVEGSHTDDGPSALVLRSTDAIRTALAYIRAVRASAVRAHDLRPPALGLTSRQWLVAGLLSGGLTDEEIGARLDLSVRTVRYDVAALLEALGVTSRFAAGARYARQQVGLELP